MLRINCRAVLPPPGGCYAIRIMPYRAPLPQPLTLPMPSAWGLLRVASGLILSLAGLSFLLS